MWKCGRGECFYYYYTWVKCRGVKLIKKLVRSNTGRDDEIFITFINKPPEQERSENFQVSILHHSCTSYSVTVTVKILDLEGFWIYNIKL